MTHVNEISWLNYILIHELIKWSFYYMSLAKIFFSLAFKIKVGMPFSVVGKEGLVS